MQLLNEFLTNSLSEVACSNLVNHNEADARGGVRMEYRTAEINEVQQTNKKVIYKVIDTRTVAMQCSDQLKNNTAQRWNQPFPECYQ